MRKKSTSANKGNPSSKIESKNDSYYHQILAKFKAKRRKHKKKLKQKILPLICLGAFISASSSSIIFSQGPHSLNHSRIVLLPKKPPMGGPIRINAQVNSSGRSQVVRKGPKPKQ